MEATEKKPWWKGITQPFVDLARAPRALWGINFITFFEGMVYFGFLGYLAMHFSDFIFQGVEGADVHSHFMVMILTAGITIMMFFLGGTADKWGARKTIITALVFLIIGRVIISAAPTLMGLKPAGLWSSLHIVTMLGILVISVGYGMFQPASYAGVKHYTTKKTSAMSYAMLYAVMNLGGFVPALAFLLRDDDYMGLGITGTYWVYTSVTLVALLGFYLILRKKVETRALEDAELARKADGEKEEVEEKKNPFQFSWRNVWVWIKNHPLANPKFAFFVFSLMPVRTLFVYNWLVMPQYINRSYTGFIGENFEVASNINPILIFILTPIITAFTLKKNVYTMMILGTAVMAAPAFLLGFGTSPALLFSYIIMMTIGEAMWSARFLQYAAEIAPKGQTGAYMGVAQFPWFLTKVLAPLYTGYLMTQYCPKEGTTSPETMWIYFGLIAIISPILLLVFRFWAGKDFKTAA